MVCLLPVSRFLLSAKETTLKAPVLEHFRQQARCFGFSREPDYQYDHDKGASLISHSVRSQSVSQSVSELTLSFPLQSSAGTTRAFFCSRDTKPSESWLKLEIKNRSIDPMCIQVFSSFFAPI